MYYKKIYIRDFGIFNNQNLEGISKNLVVIGGKNRAGKSTFLKLLRYLPFGLPKDNSIPPAVDNYYIEAELKKADKKFSLFIDGYAAPKVIDDDQQEKSASELFNNLDQLSYQHLFSISLNELQDLAKIAKGKKKEKRLYSILLGAGFSELVKVPEIADKYFNYAKSIGGKLGDPTVASFKPYYNQIREAEEKRDQALLEVDEFRQKNKDLSQFQNKLNSKKREIEKLENHYILIDLLKNNYSELKEIVNLSQKLNKVINKNSLQTSSQLNNSEINAENTGLQTNLDQFLIFMEHESKKIRKFQQKEESLKERIKNYLLQEDKIEKSKQQLLSELENLDTSWNNGLQQLENIKVDLIKEKDINQKLKKYRDLNYDIEKIESELKNLSYKLEENRQELEEIDFKKPSLILKQSYFVLALSFLTLGSSFWINIKQLKYFSLVLALTAFIYYSSNYRSSKLEQQRLSKLEKEEQLNKNQLQNKELELKKKTSYLEQLRADLNKYAKILGISEADYLSFIDSYLREVRDKKRRYRELKIKKEENQTEKQKLKMNLTGIKNLIKESSSYCSLDFNTFAGIDLIENYQILFSEFDKIKELKDLTEEYRKIKSQLKHTLNASDTVKTALFELKQDRDYYQTFIGFYHKFTSQSAVEKKKESLSVQINNLKQEKESLEEKITTVKNRINALSTSTKLESAQQKIDLAQTGLEKQAQSYAVNKSVSFILKKLRSRMIEKAETELLKPASDILSRITSHHYCDLKTAAELDQQDFRVVTEKGRQFNSTKELSRGSLEQLFLAVRLSRIKEIKPPLPLVLDDSLVNFDQNHLYNTAKLLVELASRHQIFILTCHPQLISFISQLSNAAQYWKLDSGQFETASPKKLAAYLKE